MKKVFVFCALLFTLCSAGTAWAATRITSDTMTWTNGEYVADGVVSIGARVEVTGSVTLILNDGCELRANAGIHVPPGHSLTIKTPDGSKGTGHLAATGIGKEGTYLDGGDAGIGGNRGEAGGNITIDGGDIYANGGWCIYKVFFNSNGAAGIGGGYEGSGGNITINGGTVMSTGGIVGGAGIGGGDQGSGGNITITGGTIEAMGHLGATDIGGGREGSGGSITITGGTVKAYGISSGLGIGYGSNGSGGTLSSGTGGSAWIVAESVSANKADFKSGVLIEGSSGKVYGSPTIKTDANVPSGATLTIPSGSWLDIAKGVTITNDGTIDNKNRFTNKGTLENSKAGKLINSAGCTVINWSIVNNIGTIDSKGKFENYGTVDNRGTIIGDITNGMGVGGVIGGGFGGNGKLDDAGLLFKDGGGEVLGDITLNTDLTVTKTLAVKDGATLTVGSTLTVDGELKVDGAIVVDGSIEFSDDAKARALIASGKLSGEGEIVAGGVVLNSDGTTAPTTAQAASRETIETYVAKGAGLDVTGAGKLTIDCALRAIGSSDITLNGTADEATITPLKIVSVDVAPGGVAEIIFDGIRGALLVSSDRVIDASELNVVKIISADRAQTLKLDDGSRADGTFVISRDGEIVRTINAASDDYSLVVYIADGGELDLARDVPGYVVDPLVFVKSTGREASTSGGACSAGAGLAAAAGLAALALRKRGK